MSTPPATDPETLARQVAEAMWSRDHATQALGMTIEAVGPGTATLRMTVRQDMVNGHGMCHGGLLFALADSAFAYACNSDNRNTVASACAIDFLAPARLGDVLQAHAVERARTGRMGVYDVSVQVLGGKTVALFRGKSHRLDGEVIAGLVHATQVTPPKN